MMQVKLNPTRDSADSNITWQPVWRHMWKPGHCFLQHVGPDLFIIYPEFTVGKEGRSGEGPLIVAAPRLSDPNV